jgi:hypothetical protein
MWGNATGRPAVGSARGELSLRGTECDGDRERIWHTQGDAMDDADADMDARW